MSFSVDTPGIVTCPAGAEPGPYGDDPAICGAVTATSVRIRALSHWIDQGNAHRDPEAITWGRLSKIAEECGEVISAYIGATGQNPRKGTTGTMDDVAGELLDVAVTALAALAHLRAKEGIRADVMAELDAKVARIVVRAGIEEQLAA